MKLYYKEKIGDSNKYNIIDYEVISIDNYIKLVNTEDNQLIIIKPVISFNDNDTVSITGMIETSFNVLEPYSIILYRTKINSK